MRKLDLARRKDEGESHSIKIISPRQSKAIESLVGEIKQLYELINNKQEVDLTELTQQVKELSTVIDIKDQIDKLTEVVKLNKPEKLELNFEEVIKAIKDSKSIVNIDLKPVEKAVIQLQQKVQETSVVEQAPEGYQPVRRVIKVGNRLVFDDQQTPGSRGGGGGIPNDLTRGGNSIAVVNPDGTEVGDGAASEASLVVLQDMTDEVATLVNSLKFLAAMQTTTGQLKVNIADGTAIGSTTIGAITTVTTVSSVANQVQSGGFALSHDVMSSINTNANQLRDRITVT